MAMPRFLKWTLVAFGSLVLLIVGSCVGCALSHPDATTRLASHFALDDVSSEQAIESGLAAKVPVGTSEDGVAEFLRRSGIGADELSSWHPADEDGVIVCRVEYDPTTFGFVKDSYGILFKLDERRTLAEIDVKHWLTGL